MIKLYSFLSAGMLTLCLIPSSWAMGPCMPIVEACTSQGYYQGGESVGKGLIKNCVMPVVSGQLTLPNTSFNTNVLEQCKMNLMKKMATQKQN